MERFMRAVPFWQPLQEKVLLGSGKSGEPYPTSGWARAPKGRQTN